MGLDMYAFALNRDQVKNPDALVDLEFVSGDVSATQIAYWRKFNALHGWMEDLYRSRDGEDTDFNCAKVRLTAGDLDALEEALGNDALKPRAGFFFGGRKSTPRTSKTPAYSLQRPVKPCRGELVYYDSWW